MDSEALHPRSRGQKQNQNLRNFLNDGALLPNGVRLNGISSDGVFFEDSEGKKVNLHDLSDGYRSVLSITFELVRQLVRSYGEQSVFANIEQGNMNIPLPGVVIIDEIDAHLHPTWQTRVGQWFTQYFPKLQFIVTTHSPLICRASGEHGKIFQLATPDSEHPSREITGIERDRLVYGDILDAYSTDLFGKDIERGQEGRQLQEEYRQLVYKDRYGMPMSQSEQDRFHHLTQLFRFNVDHSRSRVK
ncbi:MAG: AAA family ATPase [Bacteroidia bacterium]